MDNPRDWALPFCITAWLLAFHAGASDGRSARIEPLQTSSLLPVLSSSPRYDPDQERQQFVQDGILVDVRTSIVNGHGRRRRFVHGMARNTSPASFPRAVFELLEAQIIGRAPSGDPIPGPFDVVASQFLGDLDPGRAIGISLSLERPDTRLRVYQVRVRSLP